jgi:hypothetical protein
MVTTRVDLKKGRGEIKFMMKMILFFSCITIYLACFTCISSAQDLECDLRVDDCPQGFRCTPAPDLAPPLGVCQRPPTVTAECDTRINDCPRGFQCTPASDLAPPFGICQRRPIATAECDTRINDCPGGFVCIGIPDLAPPFGVCVVKPPSAQPCACCCCGGCPYPHHKAKYH